MRRQLPPIDLHAHVSLTVTPGDLERLGAVVFAATRSLDEFESVRGRRDQVTVWGLGCHPGVPDALSAFDPEKLSKLLPFTAYVSEVGIDRRSKVPLDKQVRVLSGIFDHLLATPRITSIHSSGAPGTVLEVLASHPIKGAVLHWWRGDEAQTRRALELGCWFSVNAAGMRYPADLAKIPPDRVLTETDHPSGDRTSPSPRQPGSVADVEAGLARIHGIAPTAMRHQIWWNFVNLVNEAAVEQLLPPVVGRMLVAAGRPGGEPPL